MAVRRVINLGNRVLRGIAEDVPRKKITTRSIQNIVDDLVDTMRDYRGIGIAAPQVGLSLRIFVIEVGENLPRYPDAESHPLACFINPEVSPLDSEADVFSPEGCLSLPGMRGAARRHGSVRIRALDRNGDVVEAEYSGFPAIVLQHEFDHLNGHVYIDRLWSHASLGYELETDRHGTLKPEYLDQVAGEHEQFDVDGVGFAHS